MDAALNETLQMLTGSTVVHQEPLGGGCIAAVLALTLADGRALVAKRGAPGSGLALEGRMLRDLAATGTVPVPEVLAADDDLLVMTRLPGGTGLDARAQTHAADLMAALHNVRGEGFGYTYDTVIGGLPQPNPLTDSWLAFFAEHRLRHRARQAHRKGQLPAALRDRVDTLAGQLDRWLSEPAWPALVHGDLWGGNILAREGQVTGLIDPALYWAHPEVELAFSTLFGTFGDAFFARYRQHHSLDDGFFRERRDLYNLYPLLVHVELFGGGYVGSVERTLTRFGV